MKKNVMMTLMAVFLSLGAMAQDKQGERKTRKGERPTAEEIAERRASSMKENLALTDEQYQKVYAIHLEKAKKMQKSETERRERFQTERAELKKQYASILTPEQLKKMEEAKPHRATSKRKFREGGPRRG